MTDQTIPTTERLARALEAALCPSWMIDRARAGYYDDFKSDLALPCMQLVADLMGIGQTKLAGPRAGRRVRRHRGRGRRLGRWPRGSGRLPRPDGRPVTGSVTRL
jgi:hypothetical protein